jgi:hypothetical protein
LITFVEKYCFYSDYCSAEFFYLTGLDYDGIIWVDADLARRPAERIVDDMFDR